MSKPVNITHIQNGVLDAIYSRDELIISEISEKYSIDEDELRAIVIKVDSTSNLKFKPQKVQPKNGVKKEKTYKTSGYLIFSKEIADTVLEELVDVPSTREFTNKKNERVVIDPLEFINGKPTIGQRSKRIGYRWNTLSEEERKRYDNLATEKRRQHEENERLKVVEREKDSSSSDSEVETSKNKGLRNIEESDHEETDSDSETTVKAPKRKRIVKKNK